MLQAEAHLPISPRSWLFSTSNNQIIVSSVYSANWTGLLRKLEVRIEGKGERKYERNYLHARRTLDVSLCTLDVSLTVDTSVFSQKWHFVMVFETFSDFSGLY